VRTAFECLTDGLKAANRSLKSDLRRIRLAWLTQALLAPVPNLAMSMARLVAPDSNLAKELDYRGQLERARERATTVELTRLAREVTAISVAASILCDDELGPYSDLIAITTWSLTR